MSIGKTISTIGAALAMASIAIGTAKAGCADALVSLGKAVPLIVAVDPAEKAVSKIMFDRAFAAAARGDEATCRAGARVIVLRYIMQPKIKSCADGLPAIGRTLPFAGLDLDRRKAAHTLLRSAYRAAEHGDEATCEWLGGAIIRQFLVKKVE
jgi:hypothetical protein